MNNISSFFEKFFTVKTFILILIGFVILVASFYGISYLLTTSNQVANTIQGSGISKTTSRQISEVRALDITIPGEVIVQNTGENSLEITADDNLISCIIITDRDNKLTISQSQQCEGKQNAIFAPQAGLKVMVKTPYIDKIGITNSANITANVNTETRLFSITHAGTGTLNATIKADRVEVRMTGSGNTVLGGSATNQNIQVANTGSFNGQNLIGKVGDVTISSSGNITINVSDALKVKSSGAGNVFYYGNPALTTSLSGFGKVQPAK